MENEKHDKAITSLAAFLLDGNENNSDQNYLRENIITDECGDTLWDDVLDQA